MTVDRLKVGDFVKFTHPNGSVGRVSSIRQDGPFKEEPRYYVTWQYGLDVKGSPMTEKSGLMNRNQLIKISQKEFARTALTPGFGDG